MMIGLALFGIFLILLGIGLSVSFSMSASTLVALIMADYTPQMFPLMLEEGVRSFLLLSVPFFILAGNLMNSTGVTQRIFDFSSALVGHIRGGLAHVNVMASMIFAGISGTAVADQSGLGQIEIKAMTQRGYSLGFSVAVTLASSVIGAIIPPSVPLIVYAFLAEVSVERLFTAGIIPGILIGILLMIQTTIMAKKGWVVTPPEEPFELKKVWITAKDGLFALLAPVVVLVGMLGGIVTPTEAGLLAVLYSIFCGLIYRDLNWSKLKEAIFSSVKSTALIMFLVGVGTSMTWIISAEKLPVILSDSLLSITENKYIMLLLINVILLILGCVMEGIPIKLIMVPILLPIIDSLGIDRIHFGIVMAYNVLIGMLTPPVGLGLYVMSTISKLPIEKVMRAVLPMYIPLFVALALITFFPQISLWLPNLLFNK